MPAGAATINARARRTLLVRFLLALLVLVGAAGVFLVVFIAVPHRKPSPSWVSSSGAPVPDDFLFAMFPADNTVPLCDAPDGKPIATLTRAVVNSRAELDAGGWVSVNTPTVTSWVHLDKLVYTPAQDDGGAEFEAFASSYRARDPGSSRNATFRLRHNESGATLATLRLKQDDRWQEYVYEIAAAGANPLEMSRGFGPAESLGDPAPLLAGAGAALAFVLSAAVGSFAVMRGKKAVVVRP